MQLIKNRLVSVFILALLLGLSIHVPVAKAHVLKTDRGVSGILHIKPDDNPVAATPTQLDVLFSTTSSSFSLNNYKLQAKVIQDGRTKSVTAVQPAYFGASSEGAATVTFPSSAVYDVVISGQPVASSNLPAFSLDYIVRVTSAGAASTAAKQGPIVPILTVGLIVAASLVMVAIRNIQTGGRYRKLPA